MKQWTLTVHDSRGARSEVEAGEREFILGSESAFGVMRVVGNGVAPRHARVKYGGELLVVEKLGGETFVNGSPIEGRVEVEYPASVEVGDVTLVVEAISNEPSPDRIAVTIPLPVRKKPEPLPEPEPPPTPEALAARIAITIPAPMKKEPAPAVRPPQTPAPDFDIHLAETIPFQRQPVADDPDATIIQPRSNAPGRGGRTESARVAKAPLKGEYTLVKEIARGGMGQIYFGEDPQLEREVAVKVSSISEGGEDPRFSKEAKVLAQLAHPNVVPIYNIGVDGERRPFYAMKLVKGRTLQAVLNALRDRDAAALKDYPLATLLTIFRKVCDAMAFAHSKRILHRDLKPENIMVGEYGEVLVMDWGLAKVLGGSGGGVTGDDAAVDVPGRQGHAVTPAARVNESGDFGMTMEGEVMGTPQYMSPEQAEGMVAELDERSDIYSLGGVLYAILTLRPPIDGKTLNEVLTKVKNGQISSMITKRGVKGSVEVGTPAAISAEVPEALRAVTLKAMAKERAKRYASVEEFAADLEAYQNGFATRAEDAGVLRKLVLFVKRNKAVSALASAMLLGAVLFTVRLAASEKVALANAERAAASAERALVSEKRAVENAAKAEESAESAKRSEQRAIEQKEVSRREAARAQLALAEAGEREADAIQMRTALDAVPEDLRDSTWRYMSERLDKSDLDILPAKGRTWLGLENMPEDSDSMLALDSAGEVSLVNLRTGEVKALWTSSVPKMKVSKFCVSKDGTVAAVGFELPTAFHVQIFRVSDGAMVGEFEDTRGEAMRVQRMWTSGEVLVYYSSSNQGNRLDAWDIAKGERLWDRRSGFGTGMTVGFSSDQKALYLVSSNAMLEKLDPRTGNILSVGETPMRGFNSNSPESVAFAPDFSRVFIAEVTAGKRPVRMWENGVFRFNSPTYGQGALYLSVMSKQSLLVGFCPGWGPSGVLEFRDWNTGYITKRIPVLDSKIRGTFGSSLRSKGEAVALCLSENIRVWRLESGVRKATLDSPIAGAYKLQSFGDGPRILASHVAGSGSLAATSCVVLAEADADGKRIREVCRAEYQGFGVNRPPNILVNAKGDKFVAVVDGLGTAFRVDDKGMHQLWKVQRIQSNGSLPCLLHPTLDLIWTGQSVLDFSTGREKVKLNLNGFKGITTSSYKNDVIWVGADRVLEVGYWGKSDNDEETTSNSAQEKVLVLWDTTSGEACLSVPAPRAAALCVSPDGTLVAEAGEDKRVRIRDAKTLAVLQEFRVHDGAVSDVVWHPRLPRLVTLSWEDYGARVWDLKECRMLEEFTGLRMQGRMTISPNGRRLLVTEKKTVVFEPKSFEGEPR